MEVGKVGDKKWNAEENQGKQREGIKKREDR